MNSLVRLRRKRLAGFDCKASQNQFAVSYYRTCWFFFLSFSLPLLLSYFLSSIRLQSKSDRKDFCAH